MILLTFMKTAGMSLVGILVGIAAGMILVVGTALLATRGFNISREHTEQVRVTEDARIQMERLSDAIRDARSLDLTGDGLATLAPEVWLQNGAAYDIQFYTNFDEDDEIERLHYFLEGTNLKRGVKDPYNSEANEEVVVLAKSLRNIAQGKPLFQYYTEDSDVPMTAPVATTGIVERVEIILHVDVNEEQIPTTAKVSTAVTPRASDIVLTSPSSSSSPSPSPSPTP